MTPAAREEERGEKADQREDCEDVGWSGEARRTLLHRYAAVYEDGPTGREDREETPDAPCWQNSFTTTLHSIPKNTPPPSLLSPERLDRSSSDGATSGALGSSGPTEMEMDSTVEAERGRRAERRACG